MGNINIFGLVLATAVLAGLGQPQIVHAQATTAISPTLSSGNLNTRVNSSTGLCSANCVITGGTRTGTNLYHSFGQFSVGPGDVANFFNETGLPTSNILGRVTGGNISNIFGSITATNFPGANLFLMNPNGFLFGPNASVNVAGMATFTTADYMRLADGGRFNAKLANIPTDVLTTSPVAAFGFLGSNPAAINFEGGQLMVTGEGTGLKLVGGDISLTSDVSGIQSSIMAPGRSVQLTSLAGPGEVAADSAMPAAGISLGNILLAEGSVISTAGDPSFGDGSGGSVSIRGGQFVASGTQILTGPASGSSGQGGAVTISATTDASFTNSTTIDTSSLFSVGNGGAVTVDASRVTLEDTFMLARAESDGTTATEGGAVSLKATDSVKLTRSFLVTDTSLSNGNGGPISITAPTVNFMDSGTFTGTFGGGSGGVTTINATSSVSLTNSLIDTHTSFTPGNSGSVTITAPTIIMSGSLPDLPTIDTSTDSFEFPTAGNAGDIIITGTDVTFTNSALIQSHASSFGSFSKGGTIQVNGEESITIESNTLLRTVTTSQEKAGDILLTSKHVTITGSFIDSETIGPGSGGTIKITGTENIALESGSVITSNSASALGNEGPAGKIELYARELTISGGTKIQSQTTGNGLGGTISMQSVNGPAQSLLITGAGSGLLTDTTSFIQDGTVVGTGTGGSISLNVNSVTVQNDGIISAGTSGAGNAGDILLKAASVSIESGGQITSSSSIRQTPFFEGEDIPSPTGKAGTVTIEGLASPAQSVLITGTGSGVFTDTQGTGAGGNIFVNANSVTLSNGGTLSATTSGTGNGGDIQVNGSTINLTSFATINTLSFLGEGSAGNIALNATQQITAVDSFLNTDTVGGTGHGGNISLRAPTIQVNGGVLSTSTSGVGPAGNIILEGRQIGLGPSPLAEAQGADLFAVTAGLGQGGTITLRGLDSSSQPDNVTISGTSRLHTLSASDGAAGDITINASQFTLTDRSTLNADTFGSGTAGTITITSSESATISGVDTTVSSSSDFGATGDAGHITLSAPFLAIESGGLVSTSTTASGTAGTITVHANTFQLLSGGHITSSSMIGDSAEQPAGNAGNVTIQGLASPGQSVLIDGVGSGIFTDTQGTGAGGNILVNANSVTLQNGGTLSAATSGSEASATGGTITVNASQVQVNSGGLLTASTTGAGEGGSINISAASTFAMNGGTVGSTATQATGGDITISTGQSVTLDNASLITASSNGQGNAGNIVINAGQQYTSTNSSVTTKSEQASGGNITVIATGLVHLTNSEINASVEGASTTVGGNILIDPVYVILENSQILAQATQGQGGNINIFYTGALLADPSTVISASSQFGQSGTVTIQSPISPASGKIVPLGQKPLVATSLLSQRCAAVAGGNISSFTVAGRDSLPAEPGNWLSSPLALKMSESEGGTVREADGIMGDETPLLSLRKIAPPGFLTQAFAVDSSIGCTS